MSDFNMELDRITERETVPDFYERMTNGSNILDGDRVIFNANNTISTAINNAIILNRPSLLENLANIKTAIIEVSIGDSEIVIPDNIDFSNVIMICSEKTMIDIKSAFSEIDGDVKLILDSPYTNNDIIKIYYTE